MRNANKWLMTTALVYQSWASGDEVTRIIPEPWRGGRQVVARMVLVSGVRWGWMVSRRWWNVRNGAEQIQSQCHTTSSHNRGLIETQCASVHTGMRRPDISRPHTASIPPSGVMRMRMIDSLQDGSNIGYVLNCGHRHDQGRALS